jgi:hypothetical protein
MNRSRRDCFGIILQIHRNSAGIDCITNINACIHGEDEEKTMDEQLDNSCRKICALIVTDNDVYKYK